MSINRDRAEGIARNMTEEERAEANAMGGPLPCCVTHPDAGGDCFRDAEMFVYGLNFCGVHGAEVRAGALRELYQDAADFLERCTNPHAPIPNAEAEHAIEQAQANLGAGRMPCAGEEDALMRAAYPVIPERMDSEIPDFDYWNRFDVSTPEDDYRDSRSLLHKLMRLAYSEGVTWLVEQLEYDREHVSAQAVAGTEDYDRRGGRPGR